MSPLEVKEKIKPSVLGTKQLSSFAQCVLSRRSQIELRCDNDLNLENEKKKQEAVDAE